MGRWGDVRGVLTDKGIFVLQVDLVELFQMTEDFLSPFFFVNLFGENT